jgi:thymidine kinase
MYLETIFGSMFSGKSTYLYSLFNQFKQEDKQILTINYFKDKRYTNGSICTHNKQEIKQIKNHFSLESIMDVLMYIDITDFDIILIDEAQFFNDIYEFITTIENEYKGKIFVAGLQFDSQKQLFGQFYKIIMLSDTITHIKGKCYYCDNDSLFTLKLDTQQTSQIDIGGSDKYIPVCRNCYNKYYNK